LSWKPNRTDRKICAANGSEFGSTGEQSDVTRATRSAECSYQCCSKEPKMKGAQVPGNFRRKSALAREGPQGRESTPGDCRLKGRQENRAIATTPTGNPQGDQHEGDSWNGNRKETGRGFRKESPSKAVREGRKPKRQNRDARNGDATYGRHEKDAECSLGSGV